MRNRGAQCTIECVQKTATFPREQTTETRTLNTPTTIHDALGRPVPLCATPRRIVSLVPSHVELLAHLGLDEEVVGITRYCIHPKGWTARKTIVGGTKKARASIIAELKPDLILANKEENTQKDVQTLETIAPVYVTDIYTLEDSLTMIQNVGALVGHRDAAHTLAATIQQAFAALPAFEPRRALYLIWRNPWMAAARNTFIDDIMARGGLHNALHPQTRYPQLTEEQLDALAPEILLLSSEPYPFAPQHLEELTQRFPTSRVCLIDGEMFSWYGNRMAHAPAYLQRLRTELDALVHGSLICL